MCCRLLCFILCWLWAAGLGAQIRQHAGHAHNDYAKKNPLFRSLERDFRSLEVDVYLKNGELRVSHFPILLGNKPTLEELYLEPLATKVRENGGTLWPGDSSSLTLYIDFKTQGATFERVMQALKPYAFMLKRWEGDSLIWGPVEVLVDRHLETAKALQTRLFSVQLPYEVHQTDAPASLVPRLNAKWGDYFKWKGKGKMPEKERKLLEEMIENTRSRGRTIRFYATGEREMLWRQLLAADPGWINVDDLDAWLEFIEKEQTD